MPSTKANKTEAPTIAWAIRVYVKMLGRRVHCLGQPEFQALLLALHHPDLVDIHEQKMLHTGPAPHPLIGYPGYVDSDLTPVLGTLNVASRLNCRQHHPRIVLEDPDTGSRAPVAFPYQGDFLLFFRQGRRIKLINWTIKKHEDDFRVPESASASRTERLWQKLQRRLLIERQYYADIGVPTVEVAQNILDQPLIANLRDAFSYKDRTVDIDHQRRSAVIDTFKSAARDGVSATDVLAYLEQDRLCDIETGKRIFFQSIWDRSLRLDLFSNVVLNAPLQPEIEDVFVRNSNLFPGVCLQGQPSPRAA